MQSKKRRSPRGKAKQPRQPQIKKLTQKQLMDVLQKEGKERIMIVAAPSKLKIPRPIHSQFKTRQEVLFPNIGSGFTSGGASQLSYIAQATPATSVFGAMAFSLQDLDQVAQLTALFDQYRIDKVIVQVRTRNTIMSLNTSSSANATPPDIYWAIDRDDVTAWTTYAQARQYDNVQVASLTDNVDIELEPSITPAIYASGAFSGYGVERTGVWIDCANTAVAHYGVKFAVTELTALATDTYYWDLLFWYYLSFRNVR